MNANDKDQTPVGTNLMLIDAARSGQINPHLRRRWAKANGYDPVDRILGTVATEHIVNHRLIKVNALWWLFLAFVALAYSLAFALGGRTPQSSVIGLSVIVFLMISIRIIRSLTELNAYGHQQRVFDYPDTFMTDLVEASQALCVTDLKELAVYDEERLTITAYRCLQSMGEDLIKAEEASRAATDGNKPGWGKIMQEENDARRRHRETYELFKLFGIIRIQYSLCFPPKKQLGFGF